MKIIKVKSFSKLLDELNQFKSNQNIIFRGQSNQDWKLLPKIGRTEFSNKIRDAKDEISILDAWKRYAVHYMQKVPKDDWDWLALAQHYGLATRLLDWTKNPLNAIFFAIDHPDINLNPAIFTIHMNNDEILKSDSSPFSIKHLGFIFPRGLSGRIIQQRSLFSVSKNPKEPLDDILNDRLYKFEIDGNAVPEIEENLEFYGINKFSIFQDLDSMSDYLNNFVIKRLRSGKEIIQNVYINPVE